MADQAWPNLVHESKEAILNNNKWLKMLSQLCKLGLLSFKVVKVAVQRNESWSSLRFLTSLLKTY